MYTEKTEGIVLQAREYKERERLITLMTPLGKISLIVKGLSHKRGALLSLTTPFCYGEYHFLRGRSDLLRFSDGTIIDDGLSLRGDLQKLRLAGTLAQTMLLSQWPDKPTQELFFLYRAYHKQVVGSLNPQAFICSFYLKVLHLEGLLCPSFEGHEALFSVQEKALLCQLQSVSRFSQLNEMKIGLEMQRKVEELFSRLIYRT